MTILARRLPLALAGLLLGAILMMIAVRVGMSVAHADTPVVAASPPDTTEHPYRPLYAQADIPADAGAVTVPAFVDAGAVGAGSASAPAATPTAADKLPNPVDDPLAAIETLKAQKKQGWAITILGGICMLTAGFSRAAGKWPNSKLFAWFAKNKYAIYVVSGVSLTSAAAFNALALGGTWLAAGYAAAGALFAMMHPGTPKA